MFCSTTSGGEGSNRPCRRTGAARTAPCDRGPCVQSTRPHATAGHTTQYPSRRCTRVVIRRVQTCPAHGSPSAPNPASSLHLADRRPGAATRYAPSPRATPRSGAARPLRDVVRLSLIGDAASHRRPGSVRCAQSPVPCRVAYSLGLEGPFFVNCAKLLGLLRVVIGPILPPDGTYWAYPIPFLDTSVMLTTLVLGNSGGGDVGASRGLGAPVVASAPETGGELPHEGGFCADARREGEVPGKGARRQAAAQAARGGAWLAIPEARGNRGVVTAAHERTPPASSATSGRRWQVSGAWTNCRAALTICLAARGNCSTGQRSR